MRTAPGAFRDVNAVALWLFNNPSIEWRGRRIASAFVLNWSLKRIADETAQSRFAPTSTAPKGHNAQPRRRRR